VFLATVQELITATTIVKDVDVSVVCEASRLSHELKIVRTPRVLTCVSPKLREADLLPI
jgi:hypothetical protein